MKSLVVQHNSGRGEMKTADFDKINANYPRKRIVYGWHFDEPFEEEDVLYFTTDAIPLTFDIQRCMTAELAVSGKRPWTIKTFPRKPASFGR